MTSPNHLARLAKETVDSAMSGHPDSAGVAEVYRALYRFMEKGQVNGGCHFLTAMAYVLLREVGIDSTLNAGWVLTPQGEYFTHSWGEVDGKVFDIAIARPNLHRRSFQQRAVMYGVEVGANGPGGPCSVKYGVRGPVPFDEVLLFVGRGTLGSYASGMPAIWDHLMSVCKDLSLDSDAEKMKASYNVVRWTLRDGSEATT